MVHTVHYFYLFIVIYQIFELSQVTKKQEHCVQIVLHVFNNNQRNTVKQQHIYLN